MGDKILEALQTIKEVCEQNDKCGYCPLCAENGDCGIRECSPDSWVIEKRETVKYFGGL